MKILVTGAGGFIGKRLCGRLEDQGDEVARFDREQGDLTQEGALDRIAGIEFVYHLAARTFVPDSWKEPHSYYMNNIMGTVTVLEYCRQRAIPLVMLSTYLHGNPQYLPVDEAHPLSAPSPYHESKLVCESLCAFYAKSYGMSIRVLRPFNVYGAGQSEVFLLPSIIKQLLSPDISVIEVLDLAPRRDYVYIDDVLHALTLCKQPWEGLQTFNIGSGVSVSVREAIEAVLRVSGVSKAYRETSVVRAAEIDNCYADITKARQTLGYQPAYSLDQGIARWLEEI